MDKATMVHDLTMLFLTNNSKAATSKEIADEYLSAYSEIFKTFDEWSRANPTQQPNVHRRSVINPGLQIDEL